MNPGNNLINNIKVLVFDWDGTLADSTAMIVDAMNQSILNLGLDEIECSRIKDVIGLGLDEAIHCLFPEMNSNERSTVADHYREHYLTNSADGRISLFPYAREILSRLNEAGYLLAVATGKSRRGLDRSLKETATETFFQTSRCADECFSKPHPQMLQEIMDHFAVKPEDTLMIGDSEYDMQMADSAGTSSIAAGYGVHDANRLLKYKPVACINSLNELEKIFIYQ